MTGQAAGPGAAVKGSSETVDAVADYVLAEVRAGRLVPGQRLIESIIATQTGAGRGPVREALRILAGRGVVQLLPNRGAWIRRLSRREIAEMVDVVLALSETAVPRAVRATTIAQRRATFSPLFEAIERAADVRDYRVLLRAVNEYHRALIRMTGNERFVALWESLYVEHYHGSLSAEVAVDDWSKYVTSYRRFHQEIVAGKIAAAQSSINEHAATLLAALRESGPAHYR